MWLMMLQTNGMQGQVKDTSAGKDSAVDENKAIPDLNGLLT